MTYDERGAWTEPDRREHPAANGGVAMKWYYRRKWMMLAALTVGTTMQLATCREEAALFGLRTAFSAFTLPLNSVIQQLLLGTG